MRRQVVWAVGWRIVAELFRRHHAVAKLRLYETHPCGGQYDCLTIYAGDSPRAVHLCDFNQLSSHFHVWGHVNAPAARLADLNWPDGNDYVQAYVQSPDPKDVIDQVESVLGLPQQRSPVPSTTAPVLTVRLIAELLAHSAFDRFGFDVRNGFPDTSGMQDCEIRPALRAVPAIAAELSSHPDDAVPIARRFWIIGRCDATGGVIVRAIVDMRGTAYSFDPPFRELRFWEAYRSDRRLSPLLEQLVRICGR